MSGLKHIPKSPREQEAAFIEADILSNLNLASGFADLAARHADLFDETGFRYSCDQFIAHAKAVAEKLKALRSLGEKSKT